MLAVANECVPVKSKRAPFTKKMPERQPVRMATIRLSPDEYEAIKAASWAEKLSMNEYCRRVLNAAAGKLDPNRAA